MNPSFKLNLGKVPRELEEFARKSPEEFEKALAIGGLQLLNWATNGTSKNDSSKPQIKTGFLRGSGSVFVGNKLIGISEGYDNRDVNKSLSERDRFKVTIGYNAVYAHRRHEELEAVTKIAVSYTHLTLPTILRV